MVKCYYCGREVALPYKCKFCGHYFCVEHHLPENHNCQALIAYKMQRHQTITYMPSPTRSFIKSEEKVLKSHQVSVRSHYSSTGVDWRNILIGIIVSLITIPIIHLSQIIYGCIMGLLSRSPNIKQVLEEVFIVGITQSAALLLIIFYIISTTEGIVYDSQLQFLLEHPGYTMGNLLGYIFIAMIAAAITKYIKNKLKS